MTGQPSNRIGMSIILGLLFAIMLALVLLPGDTTAQTNPPSGSGNWEIYDTTVISNQRVTLQGNLNVYSGGKLTLQNVDLVMAHSSKGGMSIRVRSNAQLVVNGGTIAHTSKAYSYRFIVDSGATVTMDGVTVSNLYHNPSSSSTTMEGGMQIRSNGVTVTDCTFRDSERVAMTITSSSPKIRNTTFLRSGYFTYHLDTYYVYREAYGIVVIDGGPEISGCLFKEIGDYSTAFTDAGSYTYTYLRLNGMGIYTVRGTAKIEECVFTDIGRMHTSSSVYMYVESQQRYVYFYFWSQDYRGCVRAQEPTSLEVTGCNFTGNYQGYYYYTSQAFGVHQSGGKSTIKDNDFRTNGGGGVAIFGGDTIMQDNRLFDFSYYGLYISGKGSITVQDTIFNGTAEVRNMRNEAGIYIVQGGTSMTLRNLNITFCWRGIYVTDTGLATIRDTYINNCSKKVYANAARLSCYNVTVQRSDIELGWNSAEVTIYWNLDVLVTWQNGIPVPNAMVQIFNESNGILEANLVDGKGRMTTRTLPQTKLSGTSNNQVAVVNSPLKISAYGNSLESELYTVPFDRNTNFQCILMDSMPPNVEVYAPARDHAQNVTDLHLHGIAVDVGSGLDGVEVSWDDGETWERAEGSLQWSLNIDLPEGVYDLQVRGVDKAGAISLCIIGNVTIDLTVPWLIITTPKPPKEDYIYTNQTTFTIIGQAEIGTQVFLNGEELSTTGGSFYTQITDQQEGLNTYEVMAMDNVGNRNISLIQIFQDITPPILLVEHPPEKLVTNNRVLEISGLTELDVKVTVNGLLVKVENGLFTMPMTLKEGANPITIQAVDLAQNYKVVELVVTYDVTPPEVEMLYPVRDEAVNHSTITVTGHVSSDVRDVRVNQVPVPIRSGTFSKNFKLTEGENLVVVQVIDLAGNSISREYRLLLDTSAPDLTIDGPEDGTWVTESTVNVRGRVDDVGSTVTVNDVEVEVSGGYFTYEAPLVETPPGGAPNTLTVVAQDGVGNTVVRTVQVFRDTQAPRFSVYGSSGRAVDREFINITGTVVDMDDLAYLTINEMPVQPNAQGYFEAYVPLRVGQNVFALRAIDSAGNVNTEEVTIERTPMKVSDTDILGLGNASWLVLMLFLVVGLAGGLAVLFLLEMRRGVASR